MTRYDFDVATTDLEAYYEKAFNPTQKQIWFEELQYYTTEKYKKAINKICKTSQYRPTLGIMLDTIRSIKDEQEAPKEAVECKACHGTGYIIYKKKINDMEYDYVCQCNCPNAIGLDYDGTKIADKEKRSDYYLAKAVDVFGVEVS